MTAAVRAPHPARSPHAAAPRRSLRVVGAPVPARAPEAPSRPERPPLRLVPGGRDAVLRRRRPAAVYRRRRVLVGLAAFLVVTGLLVAASAVEQRAFGPGAAAGEHAVAGPPAAGPAPVGGSAPAGGDDVHVVQPGETPWSIARRLQPDGDVRPLVDDLVERAGGPVLVAGQRLDLRGLAD